MFASHGFSASAAPRCCGLGSPGGRRGRSAAASLLLLPVLLLPAQLLAGEQPAVAGADGTRRTMRPPAYMAYPPFQEPGWHYKLLNRTRYYRGNHFWLDQF